MATLNRKELDQLERRELHLTVLAAVFVLVLAGGLASFMYPLVFVHPVGNKWTLRVAFFGFCVLTLLFVGYLLDRQRMVRHCQRGTVWSHSSARHTRLLAACRSRTTKSVRTATTYGSCRASKPARKLGLSPSSASATSQRCGPP